ncbi:MAG: hypothetical protein HOB32_05345 [Nitrospina sp.]|nr:hypothetical protein [Nitrospina sp.]MBT6601068.1 hypothetical protein [Nitrospina sp.]
MPTLKYFIKTHTGLLFLMPYAIIMVFLGLSNSALQLDEGGDTFISSTILKYGFPYHQDDIIYTMEEGIVRDDKLFVYRTWFPYYLQAGSLLLFDKTTFAARLPFALSGIISVIALYFFTLKLTKKKSISFLATLFLVSSVPALIYFRTARYVGLPILLTILLLYSYITIFEKKRWNPWPITIISIIYFHTMYVAFAGIIMGVLIHFYINREAAAKENYKYVALSAIITAVLTLPWLWINFAVFEKVPQFYLSASNLIDTTNWRFIKNLVGYIFQINNYIFPLILLPLLLKKSLRPYRFEIQLCLFCISGLIFVSLLHSIPLQQYIAGTFPLLGTLLALLVVEGFSNKPIRYAITSFLILTNLIHIGPFMPLKEALLNNPKLVSNNSYMVNISKSFIREIQFKSIFYEHLFEISNTYKGPLDEIVAYLKIHGKPEDSCYIDTERESLYFHTKMKIILRSNLKVEEAPDWIILRGNERNAIEGNSTSPTTKILREILAKHDYSKVELNSPAMRINNSYDIQIHLFRTPSSSDKKIVIYRRTNYS